MIIIMQWKYQKHLRAPYSCWYLRGVGDLCLYTICEFNNRITVLHDKNTNVQPLVVAATVVEGGVTAGEVWVWELFAWEAGWMLDVLDVGEVSFEVIGGAVTAVGEHAWSQL